MILCIFFLLLQFIVKTQGMFLSKQPVIDRRGGTSLEYITVFWLLALDCCLRPTGQHYWLMPYILDCRKDLRENSYVLRVPPNVSSFILPYCYNRVSMFVIVTAKRVTNVKKYTFNVKCPFAYNNLRNTNNKNVNEPQKE